MRYSLVFTALVLALSLSQLKVSAYFNATYLSTTVYLTNSTTVHVVESINLYVSNASTSQYNQDRLAFSLSDWQKTVGSSFLLEHIINPKGSISNFTFLPGSLVPSGNGGYAFLTMGYDENNVTDLVTIAPRKFEYSFNSNTFDYLQTAGGQSIPPNTRLTFILPNGAEVVSIYPLPDYPQPNSVGQYNSTSFSWFSGEPLQKFSFVYITTESPEQEVIQYFTGVYNKYRVFVYMAVLLVLAAIAVYIYSKVFR